jgi:preprotein translocase subunit Sec61beta
MVAGLISPSNGVDEGKKSDPLTMIAVAFSVIFVVMLAYIIAKKTKDLRLRKVDETRQVPSLK